MYYPFFLYSLKIKHLSVFPHLEGDPFIADLSCTSPFLQRIDARDQRQCHIALQHRMGKSFKWGLSPYLERRDTLLADCPQMIAEKRFFHLGLDVIIDLGTPLHAPLDAIVEESGYENGNGNYGGYVLLRHESRCYETFFSLYGHLCKDRLPCAGTEIPAGDPFAEIGDFHENGNWFYHTHIQVITKKGVDRGYITKGYCAKEDLAEMNDLCPSPIPLFRRAGPDH